MAAESNGSGETRRERLARAYRWFVARYCQADPRTLGLARIAIGGLLAAETIRHWAVAARYYSNQGVLSNVELLAHPSSEFNFSIYSAFSGPREVAFAFACAVACHVCFAVGFYSRVFSVLALLWAASLDNRLVLAENGGYVVVNLIAFWLAFLPTGTRFSVDAWRRRAREFRPRTIGELAKGTKPAWATAPHVSLGSFLVVGNLGIVYVFNVVNKYGETWRSGKTVQYVLHLDRMVTGFGVLLREHLPYRVMQAGGWLALIVEAMIAVCIAWPTQRLLARPLAMVLMVALHTTFGVVFRLGPFSWFLIGWSTLLLMRAHWEWLEAWHRERVGGPLTLLLSPTRPLALRLGRFLERMDVTALFTFESARADGPLLAVRRAGVTTSGNDAYRLALRALPFGVVFAKLARFGSTLEGNAERIERFFGLDAKEAPPRGPMPSLPPVAKRWLVRAREGVLVAALLMVVSALIHDNKSIPRALQHRQPKLLRATVGYLRIFQGWGMFSPNPVREDGILAVEGFTVDGRRIDPFTGQAPDLDLTDARGLGLGQIEQDYANRIRLDRNRVYHKALSSFLQDYHLRTGNPADELLGFDAYWLRDECPEPYHLEPTHHEKVCLVSWRKPGYFRLQARGSAIPPRCKETSAEKKD